MISKRKLCVLVAIIFYISPFKNANAFPEMIKHGYVNCTACHVSPSGGGLLNPYGRNLSAEIISTWSYKGEEGIMHGLVDTSKVDEWLAVGGDFRGVQAHTENTDINTGITSTNGRWINMQMGLEIGIIQPKWSAVAFVGEYNFEEPNHQNQILLNSPRYYGLLKPTDEFSFKFGKFQPNFGINLPDHILSTRAGLDLGYFINKQTAEASWQGEEYNFGAAYYQIPNRFSVNNEKGFTLIVSKIFFEQFKIGLQHLNEKGDAKTKTISGITGLLGWSDKLVSLIEYDATSSKPNAGITTNGMVMFQRTSYELFKGFNLSVLNDYSQINRDDGATKVYRYGPGIIWYPRPHFDLQFFFTKEQRNTYENQGDYAWLMTHYYF